MQHRMDRDHARFKDLVKGRIKSNLRKYMSKEEIFGKRGKDFISIPIPRINLPKFTFGQKGGNGEGNQPGNQPGDKPGEHTLEVDVTLDDLADLLGQELQLPRIEPKGKKAIEVDSTKYTGMRRVGPESLRSFKHTFKEALKRALMSDEYDPDNPEIIPIKEDRRYRSPEPVIIPRSQAVIFYLMDVSGSMGESEKRLARLCSFWIDTWLRKNYKNIHSRYIIHDSEAREVDQHAFYHTRESGGTRIASAYELTKKIIQTEYPVEDWNFYIFQYSDGDDWNAEFSGQALKLIDSMLPWLNQVSYCQVKEGGSFLNMLMHEFPSNKKVTWAKIDSSDKVYDVIKHFFKQGN